MRRAPLHFAETGSPLPELCVWHHAAGNDRTLMEALVAQGLPEHDDPRDTWGRQASRRASPVEDMPQQSSCVVKNTFIEIVNDSQPDMCGEPPSFIRRRQASEPPLVRREAEYDRYRNEIYQRRLQAGQAELAATKRPPTHGAPAS